MDRLEFRIKGLTTGQVRSFQRLTRPPGSWPIGLSSKGLVLWPLALLVAYGLLGPRSVKIGGDRVVWIKASEVLVLVDTSGSMGAYEAPKDAALASLRSAGISTGDQVGIGGSASNLLETITDELAKRSRVDAIWVVSDFHDGSDLVSGNNTQRYERLLRLLRQRGIRLYLSTVDRDPPRDHIQAAHASGGDWSRFKRDLDTPSR